MGNRVSVSFKNGKEESVTLFSHWGGMEFVKEAKRYLVELKKIIKKRKNNISDPIGRLEPNTVMVDFIRYITKEEELIESDLYLGKDGNDGDNSDNGHFAIDVKKGGA
jgi:hypothetical protein